MKRGSDGVRFTTEILTFDGNVDLMSILQAMWMEIGVNVELDVRELGVFTSLRRERNYEAMVDYYFSTVAPYLLPQFRPHWRRVSPARPEGPRGIRHLRGQSDHKRPRVPSRVERGLSALARAVLVHRDAVAEAMGHVAAMDQGVRWRDHRRDRRDLQLPQVSLERPTVEGRRRLLDSKGSGLPNQS